MSSKDHVVKLLPAYALGALDAGEVEQVQSHLLVCASCQDELREIEEITNDLPLALAEASPPPSIKQQLMERIELPQTETETLPGPSYWQQIVAAFQQNRAVAKGMGKSGKIGEKKPQGKRYNSKHVCKESQPFPETTL